MKNEITGFIILLNFKYIEKFLIILILVKKIILNENLVHCNALIMK